jgi:hypothetical protein
MPLQTFDFNAPDDSYGNDCDTNKILVSNEIIIDHVRDSQGFES